MKSLGEYLSKLHRELPAGALSLGVQGQVVGPIRENEVDLSRYRPLTNEERDFLVAMLDRAGPNAQVFLPQLEGLLVTSWDCGCGCPSLKFAHSADTTRADASFSNNVADMVGESSDGLVGVILGQAGGLLTELEAYDLAGRDGPYQLPRIETLAKL